MKKILLIVFGLSAVVLGNAQQTTFTDNRQSILHPEKLQKENNNRINFFVFTKEKSKKIDWLSMYTLTRARIKSFFHHKKLHIIKVESASDAAGRIASIVKRKNYLIANIWFDSHGHYGNRYSSFKVGRDQFNYKNINDSSAISELQKIAKYCDEQTKVGLGSCYAGADYYFPATDSTPASRMNGDSLMIGLGRIFKKSLVYASESWVMAKPGIFTDKFGFAGYPLNKRFKDSVYAPVWERIGKWKEYSPQTGEIRNVSTIALDRNGNIHIRDRHYNDFKKSKNKIAKSLKELKPGLAKFS